MKAVLFDLDGTLARMDIRLVYPIQSALESILGYTPAEETVEAPLKELLEVVGKKSRAKVFRIIWGIGDNVGFNFFQRIKFLSRALRNYNANKHRFELIEGAESTLQWTLEHCKVGVVTSASAKAVRHALAKIPILNEVPVIITDDDVHRPKPDPLPIIKACEQLEVHPRDTVYIGDLSTDIRAGKAAGTKTIAYLGQYGSYTASLIKKEKPDWEALDQEELLSLLKTLNFN